MTVKKYKLAQAYVIPQEYRDLFDIRTALKKGTIFKELYRERPYKKRGGNEDGR